MGAGRCPSEWVALRVVLSPMALERNSTPGTNECPVKHTPTAGHLGADSTHH